MKLEEKTVLHLIETSDVGGAERVMMSLACGLKEKGFRSIACLRRQGDLNRELIQRGIETYILKENGVFDFGFLGRLLRVVAKKQISLIHAHEFLMNMYGSALGFLSARPVVTTLHGKFYFYEKWRRRSALRLVSRLSQLVCVSEDLRDFVSANLGIPKNRIRTIYNGVDGVRSGDPRKRNSRKSELGIQSEWKVVGTIANLYPVKGHTYLLKAIPGIVARYPEVIFLFCGSGGEEQKLRTEAQELGVSEKVRFLGFRRDIPDLLELMDLFVLPSLSECLPLSVLEAMAVSLPVVMTGVGGCREMIKDRETGYIVPPADPAALEEKIVLLLQDEKQAKAMGLRAREEFTRKFSLEVMLDNYSALYDSLIQGEENPYAWSAKTRAPYRG